MNNDKVLKTINAYNLLAEEYTRQNSDRTNILPEIQKFCSFLPNNGKLLDLGCGVGYDSRDFHKLRPDLDILAIDASEKMLRQFKKIVPDVPLIKADMISYDYSINNFDGIWMNASFLHIPKSQVGKLLKKLTEALKPSGAIFIKVKEGEGEFMVPAEKYGREDIKRFFSFYTKEELESLLSRYPLAINEWQNLTTKNEKWISLIATKFTGSISRKRVTMIVNNS